MYKPLGQVGMTGKGLVHTPVIIEHSKHNGGSIGQVTQATAIVLGRYYPAGQDVIVAGGLVQIPVEKLHSMHPAVGHATQARSVGVAKY